MSDNRDSRPVEVHPTSPVTPATINPTAASAQAPADGQAPNPSASPSSDLQPSPGATNMHADTDPVQPTPVASTIQTGTSQSVNEDEGVIDPSLLESDQATALAAAAAAAMQEAHDLDMLDLDEEGFDPATLANLAALSRIAHEEDEAGLEDEDAEGEDDEEMIRPSGPGENDQGPDPMNQGGTGSGGDEIIDMSGDQVNALVESLKESKAKRKRRGKGKTPMSRAGSMATDRGSGADQDDEYSDEDVEEDNDTDMEGKDDKDGKYYYDKNGKLKRKRNRTVLSCTECHRRCDRNIPCKRCIRRGVASMCKMEAPIMPERKKRKPLEESPINYELGQRVTALETLIRAGTSMDADSANTAAMETILQATKAAGKGNVEAGNALASLSSAAGMDLSELESGERAGLLMEVLQQLSDASMPPKIRGISESAQVESDDPWSTLPRARSSGLPTLPNPSTEASGSDSDHPRLDLTLHGFREDNGRIFIPPTVRYVEKIMRADKESVLARDALPIQGDERFLSEGTKLIYGVESTVWRKGLVSSIQTHTITGALRIAASFLSHFLTSSPSGPSGSPAVYCPSPGADEDEAALKESGLEVRRFRFLDTETGVVDWGGMREDLQEARPKSVVLLYVSGTVPTGMELNASQWRVLTTLLKERQLLPLCILPFQGLSSGDIDRDANPVKFMVHEGLPVVAIQSFDAAMGIYADSPSIVSVPTKSTGTKDRVDSQLRAAARLFHEYPTPWGAQIVYSILSNAKLYPAWLNELKAMSGRLRSVREKLFDVLTNKLKTPGSWTHIRRSTGMQCTSLLPLNQVQSLASTQDILINADGSFSLGALNAAKIEILARGIDHVVRESIREQEEAHARAIAAELAAVAARELAAKEEAEAAERAQREAEEKAREEDTLLMEASIADAMEQQRREEEEEKRREEERREMDEAIRKAAERADMQRRAEAILASIGAL